MMSHGNPEGMANGSTSWTDDSHSSALFLAPVDRGKSRELSRRHAAALGSILARGLNVVWCTM